MTFLLSIALFIIPAISVCVILRRGDGLDDVRLWLALSLIAAVLPEMVAVIALGRVAPRLDTPPLPHYLQQITLSLDATAAGASVWLISRRRRSLVNHRRLTALILALAVIAAASAVTTHTLGKSVLIELAASASVSLAAVVAGSTSPSAWLMRVVKRAVLAALLLNISSVLILGRDAYFDVPRWFPFVALTGRLAGFTAHPNTLGALAGASVLICLLTPASKRVKVLTVTLSLLVLLASGSRTPLYAASVALVLTRLVWRVRRAAARPVGVAIAMAIAMVTTALLANSAVISSDAGLTVGGRTLIWRYVRDNWKGAPWLGHGPHAWALAYANGQTPNYATQAHDQWLQWLFLYGLVGLVAGTLMWALLVWQVRGAVGRPQGNIAAALIIYELVRSISESALSTENLNVASLIIVFALAYFGSEHDEAKNRPASDRAAGESGHRVRALAAVG